MRSIKRIAIILGVCGLLALLISLGLGIYRDTKDQGDSVPFNLLNDTDQAVKVMGCAGGGPKPPIQPGQTDTYYTYPDSSYASCGFYEVKTDKYLGCVPTPVTRDKRSTFRVSSADPTIISSDCGLNKDR